MKPIKTLATLLIAATAAVPAYPRKASLEAKDIKAENVDIHFADSHLVVTADLVLDSLRLGSNQQVIITPIISQLGQLDQLDQSVQSSTPQPLEIPLPSVLISGRNMHISYERGVLRNFKAIKNADISREIRRYNGRRQSVEYTVRIPLEPWMEEEGARLSFKYDPCGCGLAFAPVIYETTYEERPMRIEELITRDFVMIPEIEVPDVQIHAGRARIQFEVDRTELHVDPYVCRNGQLIDNRDQIRMIDDSVKYALSDPNVELVGIEICGYASPESPYLHNEELSNGRSKVLAEYLADRYNIPREKATYSAVIENWGEFRDMVETSNEITETQRRQLLRLIDEPASTPEQYDRKEWLLKTDPRYATLYRNLILPKWFPKLRATTFALHTQLKDMSDEQLAEVFRTTPGKMSLQQFCRVARLYPADSDEFNEVVLTALAKYPGEPVAVTNAAVAAIARGEYERARALLDMVEQTESVFNLRGLMAESERNYAEAARYYDLAGDHDKAEQMRSKVK